MLYPQTIHVSSSKHSEYAVDIYIGQTKHYIDKILIKMKKIKSIVGQIS